MSKDPLECEESAMEASYDVMEGELGEPEFITSISASNEWTNFCNNTAHGMMIAIELLDLIKVCTISRWLFTVFEHVAREFPSIFK